MPNIEALWAASFEGPVDKGHGVVVFETGRVFGGDSGWYYSGTYEVHQKNLTGRVKIVFHGSSQSSVTGHVPGQTFEIDLRGKISEDGQKIVAHGTVIDDPDLARIINHGAMSPWGSPDNIIAPNGSPKNAVHELHLVRGIDECGRNDVWRQPPEE